MSFPLRADFSVGEEGKSLNFINFKFPTTNIFSLEIDQDMNEERFELQINSTVLETRQSVVFRQFDWQFKFCIIITIAWCMLVRQHCVAAEWSWRISRNGQIVIDDSVV